MTNKKKAKTKKEVKKLIVGLGKKGHTSEKIGLVLKDRYGIYAKDFDLKIGRVLKENDLWKNTDLKNIEKKVNNLEDHLNKNHHDYPAKKALLMKSAKLRKSGKK